jgi:hypothetical protein
VVAKKLNIDVVAPKFTGKNNTNKKTKRHILFGMRGTVLLRMKPSATPIAMWATIPKTVTMLFQIKPRRYGLVV